MDHEKRRRRQVEEVGRHGQGHNLDRAQGVDGRVHRPGRQDDEGADAAHDAALAPQQHRQAAEGGGVQEQDQAAQQGAPGRHALALALQQGRKHQRLQDHGDRIDGDPARRHRPAQDGGEDHGGGDAHAQSGQETLAALVEGETPACGGRLTSDLRHALPRTAPWTLMSNASGLALTLCQRRAPEASKMLENPSARRRAARSRLIRPTSPGPS